ncbi:MAG: hypothetical protein CFE21_00720 [Bacteroidetes bacterium B1(2017)]|nr:MAG: hypothetical protein CFE21_00720 [Bacteroidetes bacterium B1(2017)]
MQKHIIPSFLNPNKALLFFVIFLLANLANAQNIVTISGKIESYANQSASIQFNSNPFKTDLDQAEMPLDGKGFFKVKLPIEQNQLINLVFGSEILRFHAAPNDSIYLVINTLNGTRTQQFYGSGALEAAWFSKQKEHFSKTVESDDYSTKLLEEMGYRNPTQFKFYLDSIANEKINFLRKNSKGLKPSFITWQIAEITYEAEAFKINYPSWYYSMRGIENKVLDVDTTYYSYLSKLNVNKPEYLNSMQYCLWLKYYFMYVLRKANKQFNATDLYAYSSNYFKDDVLKKFKLMLWGDILQYGQISDATTLYPFVKNELSNQPGYLFLEERYKDKLPFAPGAEAFPFTLRSIDGKQVSLSDFKGKVVYLDFWASWCGPCKREIPAAEELKKYFAGKDVVFLNISIDEDENKWKESAKGLEISGIHLLANSQNNPKVLDAYKISTIPAYYLIGKDGKFISAPAARPSNGIIFQQIENGLK